MTGGVDHKKKEEKRIGEERALKKKKVKVKSEPG